MAATINNFISSLLTADQSLASLHEMRLTNAKVSRTTHFAETKIMWHNREYLLSMPLTTLAQSMAQYASVRVRSRTTKLLLDYRVLPSEMSYIDSCGRVLSCDLVLEELPLGRVLSEVAPSTPLERLASVINQMEYEFERLTLRHGNLKAESIILGYDGLLYPIRRHMVSLDEDCHAEFEALRGEICAIVGCELSALAPCEQITEPMAPLNALYEYQAVGNPFGGLCVAESSAGYGYITPDGNEVIAPQFLWAANMREGRAEVETPQGMGLIDSSGRYIIEPRYQIVEFDPNSGVSRVKADGEWLEFDYQGRLIE